MVVQLVKSKLERLQKEAVMAYFEQFQHVPGKTEEIHEEYQSG